MTPVRLPPTMQVIERGWLSANSVLFFAGEAAWIVDTGYVGQAAQTLQQVQAALRARRATSTLAGIINTHSHSDHVGGNAALKAAFACPVLIPAGMAGAVSGWDEDALLLRPLGQRSARFTADKTLQAGDEIELGGLGWCALAAPGHDMHALIFYCPEKRLLISGDALWEDGFGVVFGELLDQPEALPATRATLAGIGELDIDIVIPGHGAPFTDVAGALARAQSRLDSYARDRARLARHAFKALLTFNLLDHQRLRVDSLGDFLEDIPFFAPLRAQLALPADTDLVAWLIEELLRARAIRLKDGWIEPLIEA